MMEDSGVTHKIKERIRTVVSDEKLVNNMSTSYPDKSGKWSVKLQMFYNRHFPTDHDSYAVRISVLSLALSLCAIQVFVSFQWMERRDDIEYYTWAIMLLQSAATYGLYYGIKIGDRKQFTPWIIFKTIEVFAVTISLINLSGRYLYGNRLLGFLIGLIVLGGNLLLLSIICMRNRNGVEELGDGNDEFSPTLHTV